FSGEARNCAKQITGVRKNFSRHTTELRGTIVLTVVGRTPARSGSRSRVVPKRPLRLRGISGDIKGQVWESETLLRAGRLGTLEIVLDDSSVSRRHAEVRHTNDGWHVRDLDSTNGT